MYVQEIVCLLVDAETYYVRSEGGDERAAAGCSKQLIQRTACKYLHIIHIQYVCTDAAVELVHGVNILVRKVKTIRNATRIVLL